MTASAETLAHQILEDAIQARVFPATTLEVGDARGPIWTAALGTLSFDAGSPATALDTPFDLASLTKPIATTSVMMQLAAARVLALDDRVARFFAEWRGDDREAVTVGDLLEHASGLPARLVDAPPETRREFEHEICAIRLESAPRAQSIYSDLGFLLLGFLAADAGGDLATQFSSLRPDPMLAFALDPAAARRAAPTLPMPKDPRRGRTLVGEVHDNYAAALGGVAGHAGLFGTAAAVGAFARTMLRAARGHAGGPAPFTPEQVARFTRRSLAGVPGSSRALGWDTMLPTSSCGTRMSPAAFGHVGFTGTSLWIDPPRDRYVVLLTNRTCGGGTVEAMRDVRRAFHDAVGDL